MIEREEFDRTLDRLEDAAAEASRAGRREIRHSIDLLRTLQQMTTDEDTDDQDPG